MLHKVADIATVCSVSSAKHAVYGASQLQRVYCTRGSFRSRLRHCLRCCAPRKRLANHSFEVFSMTQLEYQTVSLTQPKKQDMRRFRPRQRNR